MKFQIKLKNQPVTEKLKRIYLIRFLVSNLIVLATIVSLPYAFTRFIDTGNDYYIGVTVGVLFTFAALAHYFRLDDANDWERYKFCKRILKEKKAQAK